MSNFDRLCYINRQLQTGGTLSARQLAGFFEISPRQAKRDIEQMRDRLAAPIAYDHSVRAYRYDKPFETLRFADERTLLFYVMIRSLAASPAYVPFISQEVLRTLEHSMGKSYQDVSTAIRYDAAVVESVDLAFFSTLCHGLMDGRCIKLGYRNIREVCSTRLVEVQCLQNYNSRWYLIAWDRAHQELRTFHLGRMQSVLLSEEPVDWLRTQPEERARQVNQYLDSGFGVFHGEAKILVTICFDSALKASLSQQLWHPDQQDTETGQSFARSIPVSSLKEILGKILSFGSLARPMAPPELVQLWREEIRRMAALPDTVF